LDGLSQGFCQKRRIGWKKLYWPAGDQNVLAFNYPPFRFEVIKERLWANEQTASLDFEGSEYVHVESGDWFEVKRSAHGASNGVLLDDAIRLHLIEDFHDFLNLHVHSFVSRLD
jgi:hypothetical protein